MKPIAHLSVRLAAAHGPDLMLELTIRRGPDLARGPDFADPCFRDTAKYYQVLPNISHITSIYVFSV